jgi:hypothetical protein
LFQRHVCHDPIIPDPEPVGERPGRQIWGVRLNRSERLVAREGPGKRDDVAGRVHPHSQALEQPCARRPPLG